MGQRTKGGRYCPRCKRPVLAVKTTHRLRNAASVGGIVATGGLSLAATRVESYKCPRCGGRTTGHAPYRSASGADVLASLLVIPLVFVCATWLLLALLLGIVTLAAAPYRLARRPGAPTEPERSVREALASVGRVASTLSRRASTQSVPTGQRQAPVVPPKVTPAPSQLPVPPASQVVTHIERLAKLKEQGLLTDEEFTASKARALGTSAPVLAAPAAEESGDLPAGEPGGH